MSQPYYTSGEPWQNYGSFDPYANFQATSTSDRNFHVFGRGMSNYNFPAARGRSQEGQYGGSGQWRASDAAPRGSAPRGSWRGKRRANRGRRSSGPQRRKPDVDKRKPDVDKRKPDVIKLEPGVDGQEPDVDEHESDLEGLEPGVKRKKLDDESNREETLSTGSTTPPIKWLRAGSSSPTPESQPGNGSGGARLPCLFCRDNTFTSGGELGLHLWKKHLYCTVCCVQSDISNMGQHEPCWTSTLMMQYTCKFCSKDRYNRQSLFRHLIFKHQYCNICLMQSTSPDFDVHRLCWLKLHPRKRFFCQFCSSQFEQKKKRNQHLRIRHDTCHMCLAKYTTEIKDHRCGTGRKNNKKNKLLKKMQ